MFKRVMTILISVLAMVFVGLLLTRLPHGGRGAGVSVLDVPVHQHDPSRGGTIAIGENIGLTEGRLRLFKKDATGRKTHDIQAGQKPIPGTGRALLTSPVIRLFDKKGRELRITAPRGYFDAEGAGVMNVDDIRAGELSGGVVIRHDNGTPTYEDDDLIAQMEHCEYDRDKSMLRTDDHVTVRSPDIEIDADGMEILLKRDEKEDRDKLRELKFLHKIHIVLWQGGDKLEMQFMPGPGGQASSGAAASTTSSSSAAGTPTGSAEGEAKGKEKEPYRFEMTGNVHVKRDTSGLDAEGPQGKLTLYTWLRMPESKEEPGPAPVGDEPPESQPLKPASPPADRTQVKPVDIVCDGPFVFAPVVEEEPPTDVRILAKGEKVVLREQQIEAVGNDFYWDRASGEGWLKAPETVDVTLRDEATIIGRTLRFEPGGRAIWFEGDGHVMARVSGGGLYPTQADSKEPFIATWTDKMKAGFESQPVLGADGKPEVDADGAAKKRQYLASAEFHGNALLRQGRQSMSGKFIRVDLFAPAEEADPGAATSPAATDGEAPTRRRQAIMRVEAEGDVAVVQPEVSDKMPLGNMTCGEMAMDFSEARTTEGRVTQRPVHLLAKRNVNADHDKGFIRAEELLDVTFGPDPDDKTQDRVVNLTAKGNVRMRQDELYAEADSMDGNEATGEMMLSSTGRKMATVLQGPHGISGFHITMTRPAGDRKKARVNVTGPGSLKLLSDRDMEGRKTEKPMPLFVEWSDRMFFDRGTLKAHFVGRAHAWTATSSIESVELWVLFAEKEASATGIAATRAGGEEVEKTASEKVFENLTLLRINAERNVVARSWSIPEDPTKDVTVATIRGPNLEYKAVNQVASVDGAGNMEILEVSRLPTIVAPHERTPRSKTTVTWKRAMIFDRKDLVAWFGGDVKAVSTGLALGDLGEENSGDLKFKSSGTAVLESQILRAYLERDATAVDEIGEGGIVLSRLVAASGPEPPFVNVSRTVTFRDGDYRGWADRITYHRANRLLVLEGNPARIREQNEQGDVYRDVPAKKMEFWRTSKDVKITQPWPIVIKP